MSFTQTQFENLLHIFSHLISIDLRYCTFIDFRSEIKINLNSRFSIGWILIDEWTYSQQTFDYIIGGIKRHKDLVDNLNRNKGSNPNNIAKAIFQQ